MYFSPYYWGWDAVMISVLKDGDLRLLNSDFWYGLDDWKRIVINRRRVVSDIVLMFEGGGSFLEMSSFLKKVKFHLSWLFLLWFWSLMDNDYFIYGLDYWSLCHVRMGCKHGLNCEGKLFLVLLIEGGWLWSWSLKPWLITSGIVWWLKKELDIE